MRLLTLALVLVLVPSSTQADVFDHYTNPVLARLTQAEEHVKELKALNPDDISHNEDVLKGLSGAFLVIRTNEGRYAKLLVNSARQKLDMDGNYLSTLRVDRYTCYRQGEEQAVQASGRDLTLFPGYRLSLDLGQVVPEEVGGDVRFVVTGNRIQLIPLGKARLYLVTQALKDVEPKKNGRPNVGEKFDPSYFNGKYKLYDDGRRSGVLTLKVDAEGQVSGDYLSDKDGSKYEVRGRVGMPKHSVQFTMQLPRLEQTFSGWLFTGDAQVITGSSRLGDREAGFYAVRLAE
jgi:hypothetical protein